MGQVIINLNFIKSPTTRIRNKKEISSENCLVKNILIKKFFSFYTRFYTARPLHDVLLSIFFYSSVFISMKWDPLHYCTVVTIYIIPREYKCRIHMEKQNEWYLYFLWNSVHFLCFFLLFSALSMLLAKSFSPSSDPIQWQSRILCCKCNWRHMNCNDK